MQCVECGSKNGRESKAGMCPKCWGARYILRAVTIPVAGPVDGTWPELRESLRTCYRGAVRLNNWAVSVLAQADVVRTPEMDKLPPPPKPGPYLYQRLHRRGGTLIDEGAPRAREIAPELDPTSVSAILQAVEKRWRQRRYHVVWLGNESLPNYRYDRAVYPLHNQAWRALHGKDGEALVRVRLARREWFLRLRGGHQFRRQLAAHAALVAGRATRGELDLYEQRVNGSDHRPHAGGRDSGGQRTATRTMCKMVAWLPRDPVRRLAGTLFVATASDAMLVALNAKKNRLWTIHAEHVRRWTAENARRRQAVSDDRKLEARRSRRLNSRSEAMARKYRNRLDTAADQLAAQVARYAARGRFAAVQFVDTHERYVEAFPWHRLRSRIATKCDEMGMNYQEGVADGETDDA